MEIITLAKVQELDKELDVLIDDPNCTQEDCESMIQVVAKLEKKVENNNVCYVDGKRIIDLCKIIVMKLMLKIIDFGLKKSNLKLVQ
jgi:hypothetical protein